jgi:hypothetical protein
VDCRKSIQRDRLCDTRRGSCPNRAQSSTGSYRRWIWTTAGVRSAGFGWTYPHFLEASSWTSYLYAAPLGLVPCPTLSLLVGVSLIVGSLDSKAWANTVAAAALVYGVIGVFALGVAIDAVLLAGAIVLGGNPVFGVRRMDACRNTILP